MFSIPYSVDCSTARGVCAESKESENHPRIQAAKTAAQAPVDERQPMSENALGQP